MAHIFVTQRIPGRCFELIRKAGHTLEVHKGSDILSTTEIIERIGNSEVLLCTLANEITSEVFDSASDLKMVANYAVGYDNIDVTAATARGVIVTNTPGALTETTADLAFALLMACARRIVEGDSFCRAGEFKGWLPSLLLGSDVYGKTIGILGAGRIGSAVARRARGFSMRILYHNRSRNEEIERELGAVYVSKNTILSESDYLSIHLPLSKDTYHFLDSSAFSNVRKGICLINTGRGAICDEEALVKALESGTVASAGLDVFEFEPRIHKKLLNMPNVVMLPHIGSATVRTRSRMGKVAAANILAYLHGAVPPNVVNP